VTSNAHELGATVGAWNAVIRRARIGRDRKAAALVLSSYARADGTRIHCGVARLAVDLEASYSTARRYLAWLREVGLIELVRAGNRRRNLSDEYRLILGPDVLEHLEVLDPADHKKLTDGLRATNRGAVAGRRDRAVEAKDQRSPMVSADGPVDNSDQRSSLVSAEIAGSDDDQRSSRVSAETAISAQNGVDQRSPMGERPSSLSISPEDLSSRKPSDDGDVGGRVTVGAADASTTKPRILYSVTQRPGADRYEPPAEDLAVVEARARRGRAAVDAAIAAAAAAKHGPSTRPPPAGRRLAPVTQLADARRAA
jgi:DNA-binding transcriptional ArsR family regulator